MATYGGQIKFIDATKKQAIVFQTDVNAIASEQYDGYRFVKADFSALAKDALIGYTYTANSPNNDITIVALP